MSSMYILDAPGYPTSGAFAMSGDCTTGVFVEQWKQQPKSALLIDSAVTDGTPANGAPISTRRLTATEAVKVRNHVLLSSAQERSP